MPLTNITGVARSEGDPRVQQKGPSSLTGADRLARALGWFSIGLGITELVAPGELARTLGLDDKEGLIRAYGARELASAVPTLSVDKPIGLAARIGGDALDLGTLAAALHRDNPKRRNAAIATAMIAGITLLDLAAYAGVKAVHPPRPDQCRPRLFRPLGPPAWRAGIPRPRSQGLRNSGRLSCRRDGRRRTAGAHVMSTPASEAEFDASARAAVTIGRPADELRTLWLDPGTQSRIWTHFADVTPLDDRTAHWVAHGPAGGEYRWRTEVTGSGSDGVRWSSLNGADVPNTGRLVFRPAPGDRGTELHLEVRFDPPGGAVGEALSKLFHIAPAEIVRKALYKFRALALTGEIPTADPQPAARHGGTDR